MIGRLRASLPEYLQGGPFVRLLIGQFASAFGDWMATIALMALVLDLTGSPAAVGGILALRLMPSAFAGPIATRAALKWDRRKIMLVTDFVRAPLVVLIPFVDALWWVYSLAFVTELLNLVFLPARDSSVPDLVDEEDLPAANGLVLVSSYANIAIGAAAFAGLTAMPPLFGGVISRYPYGVVFVLDAITYLISFAYIRSITIPGEPSEDELLDDEQGSTWKAFINSFKIPLLRNVLPGIATVMLGAGALFSLGIVYVQETLGATTIEFGFLIAIFGLGAGGAVLALQQREKVTLDLIRIAVLAMGVILSVMSLLSSLPIAFVVAVAFGAAAATALVGGITYLQDNLEGRNRTLGFTAFHVTLRFGMSVAAIGAGFAADHLPAVDLPFLGRLDPTALVMFASGILVAAGGLTIPGSDSSPATAKATT